MKFKYHRWFQWLVVPLVAFAFHIYFGYRVIGRENIPEGGCVVCPNHIQLSDPPFAAVALGSVRAGQKLIIFPQGTRGAAEGETKKGAAMLAVKSRAPILPMYITEGKGFRCRATVVIGEAFTPDPKTKEYGALADDILRRIYALKEKV